MATRNDNLVILDFPTIRPAHSLRPSLRIPSVRALQNPFDEDGTTKRRLWLTDTNNGHRTTARRTSLTIVWKFAFAALEGRKRRDRRAAPGVWDGCGRETTHEGAEGG